MVFAEKAPWVLRNLAIFVFGLVLAFRSSIVLSLAVLAVFPIVGSVLAYMHHQSSVNDRLQVEAYAHAGRIAHEILHNIRTVISYNRQSDEIARYQAKVNRTRDIILKRYLFDGVGWGTYTLTMFFAFSVSFFVGGWLVAGNHITPGAVLNSFSQIAVGVTALGNLGQASRHFELAFESLDKLSKQMEELEASAATSESVVEAASDPIAWHGKIEFQNVWFRYPTRLDHWVLQDFCLEIPAGQHIAIVGASGCGKSTLMHLLMRLYPPTSGKILVDGVDISCISTAWLYKHIGIASQHSELFDGTVRDNVALGAHADHLANVPFDTVQQACRVAQAEQFILDLAQGYDTDISGHATQLSGGQIQRLAVARALLAAETGMLLLDEATSALDPATEQLLMSQLHQHCKSQTVLSISHRVASLDHFDRIIVLDQGSIVEDGLFCELAGDCDSVFYRFLEKSGVAEQVPSSRYAGRVSDVDSLSSFEVLDDTEMSMSIISEMAAVATGAGMADMNAVDAGTQLVPFLILGFVGTFVEGLQFPLQGYVIGKVVAGYSLPTPESIHESTVRWSTMMLALGVGVLCASVVHAIGFGFATSRNVAVFRVHLLNHIVHQDMAFFDGVVACTPATTNTPATDNADASDSPTQPAESTTLATPRSIAGLERLLDTSAEKIGFMSANFVSDVIQSIVNIVLGAAIGIYHSWHMAVVMVLPVPLIVLLGQFQGKISN
eukprot:jgi/Hompol1/1612/HPOL_005660-RA